MEFRHPRCRGWRPHLLISILLLWWAEFNSSVRTRQISGITLLSEVQRFPVIAEEIDSRRCRIDLDFCSPRALLRMPDHLLGIFVRDEFLQISRTAVGATVIDPPDASRFLTGIRSESNGHFQNAIVDLSLDRGW